MLDRDNEEFSNATSTSANNDEKIQQTNADINNQIKCNIDTASETGSGSGKAFLFICKKKQHLKEEKLIAFFKSLFWVYFSKKMLNSLTKVISCGENVKKKPSLCIVILLF